MAASKLYYNPETKLTFKSSGGDVLFTPTSIADQTLRVSDQLDRGSGAKPGLYRWRAKTRVQATVVAGRQVRIYLVQTDDATDIPGRIGASDASFTSAADQTRNLGAPIGYIAADSTSTSDDFIATGVCFLFARFVSLGWFNDQGAALNATGSNHYFELTPIPPEAQ